MSVSSIQLQFRQAQKSDADYAVPLIYSSGPDAWEYVFGSKAKGSALNFLHFAFKKGNNQFGWCNHTVGTIDGEVIGCATYYSKSEHWKYLFQNLYCILCYFPIFEIFSVIIRGLKIEKVITNPKKNSHCIAHVGIDPKFQGKGLGHKLMLYMLEIGRELNRERAELDVLHTNTSAIRLYHRLGFKDEKTIISNLANEFASVGDHIKMIRSY